MTRERDEKICMKKLADLLFHSGSQTSVKVSAARSRNSFTKIWSHYVFILNDTATSEDLLRVIIM